MDLIVYAICAAFLFIFAILGLWKGSLFAFFGMLFGMSTTLWLLIDNAITVARDFATIWRAQNVSAYPAVWLLVFLTVANFVVIVKRMRSI